ncbi:MAG: ABC transporter permease [Phycisphaerales bacterium]
MSVISGHHERIPDDSPADSLPAAGRMGGWAVGLVAPVLVAWTHRSLIDRMARREIAARYRGSMLGLGWAVITPLVMLGVYTFVFAVVLKARWSVAGSDAGGTGAFAARLFLGLILFQILASMMTETPALLRQNSGLVKKVVFPLEALVMIRLQVALFDFLAGFLVFLAIGWLIGGGMSWGILLVPLAALPVALLGLGIGWLLSGLGAYFSDLSPLAATAATFLMFMSGVFYPTEIVPERWMWVIDFNPVAQALDAARGLAFEPMRFDAVRFGILVIASWIVALVGLAVFRRVRGGFADVL